MWRFVHFIYSYKIWPWTGPTAVFRKLPVISFKIKQFNLFSPPPPQFSLRKQDYYCYTPTILFISQVSYGLILHLYQNQNSLLWDSHF